MVWSWNALIMPTPIELKLGDNVTGTASGLGGTMSEKVTTETTVSIPGLKTHLTIPAVKGETFVGSPINWIAGSEVYWVKPLGVEDTMDRIQYETLKRPEETVVAKTLNPLEMYLAHNPNTGKYFRVLLLNVTGDRSEVFFVDLGLRYYIRNEILNETVNGAIKQLPPSAVPVNVKFDYSTQCDPQIATFERALNGESVRMRLESLEPELFGYSVELVGNEPAGNFMFNVASLAETMELN